MESNRRTRGQKISCTVIAALLAPFSWSYGIGEISAHPLQEEAVSQQWRGQAAVDETTDETVDYSPAQLYQLAANAYTQQDWQEAIGYFRQVSTSDAEESVLQASRFYMAESLMQLGEYREAEQVFETYQKSQSESESVNQEAALVQPARILYRLAECRYLLNDHQEALKRFEHLYEQAPEDPLIEFILPFLGELYLREGQPELAAERYQQCLNQFPNSSLANRNRLGLAQAFQELEDFENAARFYQFLTMQTQSPLAATAKFLLGKMHVSQANWTAAREQLQACANEFDQDGRDHEVSYLLAKCDIGEQKMSEAWQRLKALTTSTNDQDLDASVFVDAGLVAMQLEHFPEAQQLFERARQQSSDWDEVILVQQAEIADQLNESETLIKIVAEFRERFSESKQSAKLLLLVAKRYYAQKDFLAAAQSYQELLTLEERGLAERANRESWLYLLGLAELGQKRYRQASQAFQKIQSFHDDDAFEASVMIAQAAAWVGQRDFQSAIPCYLRFLELKPNAEDAVDVQLRLITAYRHEQQWEEASEQIERLVSAQENDSRVWQTIESVANAARDGGEKETAQKMFRLMTQATDDEIAARGTTGLVWTSEQEDEKQWLASIDTVLKDEQHRDDAVEALLAKVQTLQAQNQYPDAIQWLKKILETAPESQHAPVAMIRLAMLLKASEQLEEAEQWLETLITKYPEHALYPEASYERAWTLQTLERIPQARQAFQEIAENQTESPYVWDATYRAATLAKQAGDLEDAIPLLQRLVSSKQSHALAEYALYALGEIAIQQEDWHAARENFQTIQQQYPEGTLLEQAQYWRAESEFQLGALTQAKQQFEQLVPNQADGEQNAGHVWLPTVFLRLAQCAAAQEEWKQVVEYAERSVQEFPKQDTLYKLNYLLARAAMARADFQQARKQLQLVLTDPIATGTKTAAMSQWLVGESYFHQENLEQALVAYQLVDATYDYPEWRSLALVQMVQCHRGLGQESQAAKLADRIFREFPDSDAAERATALGFTKRDTHSTQYHNATFSKPVAPSPSSSNQP